MQHPTRALLMEDSIGCLSQEDAFQISQGEVSHGALIELLSNGNYSTQKQQEVSFSQMVERERTKDV